VILINVSPKSNMGYSSSLCLCEKISSVPFVLVVNILIFA
jgi:hypothetical protein